MKFIGSAGILFLYIFTAATFKIIYHFTNSQPVEFGLLGLQISHNTRKKDKLPEVLVPDSFLLWRPFVITTNYRFSTCYSSIPTVISRELPLCPACRCAMINYGYRLRNYYDKGENHQLIRIRRLFCPHCRRIHHELPSFLYPGKLYTVRNT